MNEITQENAEPSLTAEMAVAFISFAVSLCSMMVVLVMTFAK